MILYFTLLVIQIPLIGFLFNNNEIYGSYLYAIIDIVAIIYLIMFIKIKKRLFIDNTKELIPVFLYLFWISLSAIWSISDNFSYNMQVLCRDFVRVIIVLLFFSRIAIEKLTDQFYASHLTGSFLFILISIFTMDYVREIDSLSTGRMMYDGYKDANPVARQAGFLLLILLSYLGTCKDKYKNILYLSISGCIIIVFLTFSKTTTFSLLISFLFSYGIYKTNYSIKIKYIFYFSILITFILYSKFEYLYAYFLGIGNHHVTFTASGRVNIWLNLFNMIFNSFWVGNGIGSIHKMLKGLLYKTPGTAHNEILQQIISYGIVGLFLWIYLNIKYIKNVIITENIFYLKLTISCFIFYLIIGFTESNLVTTVFPIHYLAFFILFMYNNKTKHK